MGFPIHGYASERADRSGPRPERVGDFASKLRGAIRRERARVVRCVRLADNGQNDTDEDAEDGGEFLSAVDLAE